MAITGISIVRRDPASSNASGLIAGPTGAKGDKGDAGPAGPQGRSVASLSINSSNTLVATYDDGTTQGVGPVTVLAQGYDGGTF